MPVKHKYVKIEENPNEGSANQNRFNHLPEIATASQVAAGATNEGGIFYDSTLNVPCFSDGASWTALSTTAGVGSLDQVLAVGASSNEASVTFSGSAASATAFRVGGAAANDKVVIYHDTTNAHINTLAGDLHIEPVGGDIVVTGDIEASAEVKGATVVCTGALSAASGAITGLLTVGSIGIDAIAASTAGATLKVDGEGAGGVNICSISTGGITLSDDANLVAAKTLTLAGAVHSDVLLISLGDIAMADGRISITDNDNAASFVLTNDTYTNGASGLVDINAAGIITGSVINVVADNMTTGSMVYLESSAAAMNGYYLRCYDGAANDFSVGLYGATIIAGNTEGTAALTVNAGDLKLTAGVIDQDGVGDNANIFTRACAATTKDFVQILCTDAADDECALYVAHSGTGAINGCEMTAAGSANVLLLSNTKVDGRCLLAKNGIVSATAPCVELDGTTNNWIGAANKGMLELTCDGALAAVTTSCLRIAYSGTPATNATMGTSLRIVDTGADATCPAVYISSGTSEAMKVDVGKAYFDEGIIVGDGATGYVSSLGAQDLVLRTNEGTNSGTITIADGLAGNITITPNTTGRVAVTGPARADGTAFHGIPQIVGMPFVAGSFSAQDDLVLFNAAAPKCIIMDYWVTYTTEEAITLILRDAVNGGGNVKAEAIDITAAGPEAPRTDGVSAPAVAAGDSLVVHASGNPAAAVGTVYVMYMEVA